MVRIIVVMLRLILVPIGPSISGDPGGAHAALTGLLAAEVGSGGGLEGVEAILRRRVVALLVKAEKAVDAASLEATS
ncbi:hypothetical protein GUJ93_ZPchr0012g20018 [Zizania palustris]|uniref:Secreted protein n=1 Tax=Zizania palustris TaxID=103762 RepID=A0A8J6BT93_ZIZPA|nr:hypothetical protein GUJ93_ZPchr0002g26323 [Zizania palustris]KAG8092230.1 hypothetical protein GUJ93_ZPchr0012g20018 [Zizania palustris]